MINSKNNLGKLKKYLNKKEKNGQLTLYKKFGIEKGEYIEAYLIIDTTKKMTKRKHLALANVLGGRFKYKEEYEQLKNEIIEGNE